MDNREESLEEIFQRIAAEKSSLQIVSFIRTPTIGSELADLPCIFMLEGIDQIIKKSQRSNLGYPATRIMEIPLEIVVNKRESINIKTLCKNLRKAAFKVRNSNPAEFSSIVAENAFIQESRTEGPTGYGLPDIEAMTLVLELTYIDGGL